MPAPMNYNICGVPINFGMTQEHIVRIFNNHNAKMARAAARDPRTAIKKAAEEAKKKA